MLGKFKTRLKRKLKEGLTRLGRSEKAKTARQKFDLLGSDRKSLLIKVSSLLLAAGLVWVLATKWSESEKKKKGETLKEEEVAVQLDETLLQETWIERAAEMVTRHEREIVDLRTEMERINESMANIEKMFAEIKTLLKRETVPTERPPGEKKPTESPTQKEESPEKPPEKGEEKERIARTESLYGKTPKPVPLRQVPPPPRTGGAQGEPKAPPQTGNLIYVDYTPPLPGKEGGKEGRLKEMLMFPPGSFARAVLLTGVNAPTGMKAKTQPQPVVLLAKDLSFLPNDYRVDIDRCFLVGEAYGELASERVYVRVNRISCIAEDRRILVAEGGGPIGYVVDMDGRIGLDGRVVSRRGALLARSLLANFIEGVAKAFRASLTTVSVTPLGGTITADQSTSDAFKIALGEGVGKSLEELAKMYQELASQTFPVIVVPAGRKTHVVMLAPVEFKAVGRLSEKLAGEA